MKVLYHLLTQHEGVQGRENSEPPLFLISIMIDFNAIRNPQSAIVNIIGYHIVLTLILLTGCGYYSFSGSIPPHIKNISIPLFDNETAEYGIAENITDEVTNVFIEENILRVVDEKSSNSILRGTIKKVTDRPYTYSETEEVTEYRFSVTIEAEWYDVVNDKILLKKSYSSWGAYSLTADIATDGIDNDGDGKIDSEDPDEIGDPRTFAAKVAVGKIANDIINDIVSTW